MGIAFGIAYPKLVCRGARRPARDGAELGCRVSYYDICLSLQANVQHRSASATKDECAKWTQLWREESATVAPPPGLSAGLDSPSGGQIKRRDAILCFSPALPARAQSLAIAS
jgi:hypothetical protein